jgi:cyclopropane fatty-acyl-phospholipid synthase-like methyltransferase
MKPTRHADVQVWIDVEVAEQKIRYEKIAHAMNIELADQREVWIKEFYDRITTTGTNVHADMKKVVKKEELFQKPDREFKVVF